MKLSALLIVKNEAPIVATALRSVQNFDEIVVVDTGSTDDTIAVCEEFTNLIFSFPWRDDFSAARNFAISKATGDWCYSIDADHELLSPVETVRGAATAADARGHMTALVHSDLGGAEAWREVLFKRDPTVRWVGAVHEYLTPAATFRTDIKRRCGYSKNHHTDPQRNLRILLASEDSPRNRFYLGREYFDLRRYDDAVASMGRYLESPTWLPEVVEAHITIARSHWAVGRGGDARAAALEAVRNNPDCGEALMLMSQYHYEPWRSKWAKLAAHATNRDVLFVR